MIEKSRERSAVAAEEVANVHIAAERVGIQAY